MLILAHIRAIHGLVLVLVAASVVLWHKTLYHFETVERGRLYRSGAPGRVGLWLICRLYGIRTIVNLASERDCDNQAWYKREEELCRKRRIELVRLPMLPGIAPDARQIRRFLEVVQNDAQRPALVHCMQGVARTNMMVAVYLKERFGAPNEQILGQLPTFGHRFVSPRYNKMKRFILEYTPEEGGDSPMPWANHNSIVIPQVPCSGE